MDVETLAVAKVSSMLARCPRLKSYITSNDKTPFTDGHIDVYSGLRITNEDWKGRVPIQVKGRSRPNKRPVSKFSISRTDLTAFRKDRGVLYFVVTVHERSGREVAYYSILSPFKIDELLEDVSDDRRSIDVPLTKLPDDTDRIERIVLHALTTRDQQLTTGLEPLLERARSFTVHTATAIDVSEPLTLSLDTTDFALVLNTLDGLSVQLPGEFRILPRAYASREVDLEVRSGDVAYDHVSIRQVDAHRSEFKLSPCLKLTLAHEMDQHPTDVSLTHDGSLAQRLKAVEFLTALLNTKSVQFGGSLTPIEISRSGDDTWLEAHLDNMRRLNELFVALGVDTNLIDLDGIDDEQMRQLEVLHRAFVRGEEIKDASLETAVAVQQVGPWQVIFVVAAGSEAGSWRLTDPFAPGFRQQFRWSADGNEPGVGTLITAYDVIEDDRLDLVINLHLDQVVEAYQAIADAPSTFGVANNRVVALIGAADRSEVRRDALLRAAENLNDWLIDEEGDKPRHLVNRWQITWRQRELSTEERKHVRQVKRDVTRSPDGNGRQIELACALLLGDLEEAEDLKGQLSTEDLMRMEAWPIWLVYERTAGSDARSEHAGRDRGVQGASACREPASDSE